MFSDVSRWDLRNEIHLGRALICLEDVRVEKRVGKFRRMSDPKRGEKERCYNLRFLRGFLRFIS